MVCLTSIVFLLLLAISVLPAISNYAKNLEMFLTSVFLLE